MRVSSTIETDVSHAIPLIFINRYSSQSGRQWKRTDLIPDPSIIEIAGRAIYQKMPEVAPETLANSGNRRFGLALALASHHILR